MPVDRALVGVVGLCLFAQMAARVAVVSGRATFEIIRVRLGPRFALVSELGASLFTSLMTAEVGTALALQLASSVSYLSWGGGDAA